VKANRERLKVTYEYTLSDPAYLAQPHEHRVETHLGRIHARVISQLADLKRCPRDNA